MLLCSCSGPTPRVAAVVVTAVCTLVALLCTPARAQGPASASAAEPPAAAGELLVRFGPGADAAERRRARSAVDARVEDNLSFGVPGLQVLKLAPGASVDAAVEGLERRDGVLYAEPNYVVEALAVPNDSRFAEQWGLHNTGQTVDGTAGTPDADIDAPEAWDLVHDAQDVTVAVVDGGAIYDHPDLAANMWQNAGEIPDNAVDDDGNGFVDDSRGWDFAGNDSDPAGTESHGTLVASILAARGDNDVPGPSTTDIAGVTWRARLMNVRVLNGQNGTAADVVAGFLYAARMGARVVNVSIAVRVNLQSMQDALASAPEVLFVAGAANDGADNDGPAIVQPCESALPNVVCVAATDQNDALASFSNYGAASVDLAAPGTNLLAARGQFQNPFTENFETDLAGRWVTGGSPDTWARTSSKSSTGTWSLTDSPAGNYPTNADNWARTAAGADLGGLRRCVVEFDVQHDLPGPLVGRRFAYVHKLLIEAAANAAGPWVGLGEMDVATGPGFNRWAYDLGSLSGQPGIHLRFRFTSDSTSFDRDGVYLDNVELWCQEPGFGADAFRHGEGTSLATPHASGVAALLWSRFPAANVAEVRSALLAGVDPKPSLSGKVATGGRLNARGALDSAQQALDPDGDGLISRRDNCPGAPNAGQENLDGDGQGDACDEDDDNDGHGDGADNCAAVPNGDQADADGAGGGDACDEDDDNDGRPDTSDACPIVPAATPDGCPPPPADPNLPTDGPDTITGSAGPDTLCGLLGDDTIAGLAGNDTLFGDACNDRAKLFGAQAGSDGNDNLSGDDGDDSLYGAGGRDRLRGGRGRDKLFGGDGDDTLEGGDGKDALDGGRGNDRLAGGRDANTYKAGAGNDSVNARNGRKETVDCGSGKKDKASVDKGDRAKGCEQVKRAKR